MQFKVWELLAYWELTDTLEVFKNLIWMDGWLEDFLASLFQTVLIKEKLLYRTISFVKEGCSMYVLDILFSRHTHLVLFIYFFVFEIQSQTMILQVVWRHILNIQNTAAANNLVIVTDAFVKLSASPQFIIPSVYILSQISHKSFKISSGNSC